MMRAMMDGMIAEMFTHPLLAKAEEETIETEISIPTNHDGQHDVVVHVYTPMKLKNNTKKAAFVYAHGGGAIAIAATCYRPFLSHLAVNGDVVVYNVDYRLAPETKCPNNVKDFYAAVKYVVDNAEKLGVDAGKIAIGGESGGGYITLGTMVLLAQNDETDLVKFAMPEVPMVADYCFSDPAAMTKDEREMSNNMRKIWKLIATDIEKQNGDPLLFPGKASDELLEKMPPTIILEAEFDFYITEATRFANRLRAAGRLLEFIVLPGAKHASGCTPKYKAFTRRSETVKKICQEYLHK